MSQFDAFGSPIEQTQSTAPPGFAASPGWRPELPSPLQTLPAQPGFLPPSGSAAGRPDVSVRTGVWRRIGSYMIDAGGAWAVELLAAAILKALEVTGGSLLAWRVGVLFVTYGLLTVGVASRVPGATLGKLIAGQRTVDAGGIPIGAGRTLMREYLCGLLYFVPLGTLIDGLVSERAERRSLRDKWAGTFVIELPAETGRPVVFVLAVVLAIGVVSFGTFHLNFSTNEVHGQFVSSCLDQPNTSAAFCDCAWDYTSARVSTFDLRSGPLSPQEQQIERDAGRACAGLLPRNRSPASTI